MFEHVRGSSVQSSISLKFLRTRERRDSAWNTDRSKSRFIYTRVSLTVTKSSGWSFTPRHVDWINVWQLGQLQPRYQPALHLFRSLRGVCIAIHESCGIKILFMSLFADERDPLADKWLWGPRWERASGRLRSWLWGCTKGETERQRDKERKSGETA